MSLKVIKRELPQGPINQISNNAVTLTFNKGRLYDRTNVAHR